MTQGENLSYQGGECASYQGAGGNNQQMYGYPKPDVSQAARYAKQHIQDDGDDDDDKEHLFSSVLSKLQPPQENPHLDETEAEHAAHAHEKIYNNQNNTQASSRDMGSAAAMQAFKMFSGGNKSSGGSSNELVGLAMGEAMKLFKSQGGSSSGANQSEMLQQAAMMAMKLYMTQQAGNNQGGASGGGLGQVMGILGSLSGGQQQQQQPQKHSSGVSSLLGKFL